MLTRSIILYFLVVSAKLCLAHDCFLDSMQQEIMKDFKGIYQNRNSSLNSIKFILPDCKSIDSANILNHRDIYQNPYSYPWYWHYLTYSNKINSKYLVNQANGDDWIIGWYSDSNIYLQFIDGRSFTVLIRFNNNDTIPIAGQIDYKAVYKILSKYIKCSNLYINGCSTINVTNCNDNYFEGYFSGKYFEFSELKKDFIWSNGRYVVLDIIKICKPYKMIKGIKYYDYKEIIDGIPKSDKRSFTRFRLNNNIDLNSEMYKVFPWMRDSIRYFQTHIDTELYGRTPIYILDSKEDDDKLMQEFKDALQENLKEDTCN
jgi:hypothetical protein